MDNKIVEKFRVILESKRNEILADIIEENESLTSLKENGKSVVEEYERASSAVEAELQENLEESELRLLNQVEEALGRISQGNYGVCSGCGKEIAEDRLEFIPYTAVCKECAKKKK